METPICSHTDLITQPLLTKRHWRNGLYINFRLIFIDLYLLWGWGTLMELQTSFHNKARDVLIRTWHCQKKHIIYSFCIFIIFFTLLSLESFLILSSPWTAPHALILVFILEQEWQFWQWGAEIGQEGELQGAEEELQGGKEKGRKGAPVHLQGWNNYSACGLAKSAWITEKLDQAMVRAQAWTVATLPLTEGKEWPLDRDNYSKCVWVNRETKQEGWVLLQALPPHGPVCLGKQGTRGEKV